MKVYNEITVEAQFQHHSRGWQNLCIMSMPYYLKQNNLTIEFCASLVKVIISDGRGYKLWNRNQMTLVSRYVRNGAISEQLTSPFNSGNLRFLLMIRVSDPLFLSPLIGFWLVFIKNFWREGKKKRLILGLYWFLESESQESRFLPVFWRVTWSDSFLKKSWLSNSRNLSLIHTT